LEFPFRILIKQLRHTLMARGGKMMKTKGIIVCLTAMMFLLTGMYLMVPTAAGVTRINTSIAGDLVNIDPAHLSIGPDRMIAHQVLEGLVEFDCGTSPCKPLPRLAESHKISANAKMIRWLWGIYIRGRSFQPPEAYGSQDGLEG
jgi:ABC-type transport system substrate-binding protein